MVWLIRINGHLVAVIEPSLSKPHTSGTALKDSVYVGLLAYVHVHVAIYGKLRTDTKVHVHFKFAHMLKLFKIHVQCKFTQWTPYYLTRRRCIYWMQQKTPHRVTQRRWIYRVRETDCVWSERKGLLKSSVALSTCRFIGVELDSEGSIMTTCTEH